MKTDKNPVGEAFGALPEINVVQFARRMGVNRSLLAEYIGGSKKPSGARLREIEDALHSLGRKLCGLSLL